MCKKVRVLLIDDNPEFASNFKEIVSFDDRLEYLGNAPDWGAGVSMTQALKPDIVVMDLNLSGCALDGIDAAKEIRIKTGIPVLLLTAYESEDIILNASKKSFASGYVFKSQFMSIADVIFHTAGSNTVEKTLIKDLILRDLTCAEAAVLKGLVERDVNKYTHASPSTIEKQLSSIYRKLGVRNSKELLTVFRNW